MKKVLSIIGKILMIIYVAFVALYLLFIVIHSVSFKNSIFGYRIYTVSDNTMKKYRINDIVLVKNINSKKIKKDNIIAYNGDFNNDVVLHRVVEVKEDKELSFITKGDNNSFNDPVISNKKVIGKVVGVIPVVSLFNHILKNQIGFFLLAFLPLCLMILSQIFQTIVDINHDKEKFVFEKIKDKKKKKAVLETDNGEIEII